MMVQNSHGGTMPDESSEWELQTRQIWVKSNSDLSNSHVMPGKWSPLARDRTTNAVSQVIVGEIVEPDEGCDDLDFIVPAHGQNLDRQVDEDAAPDITGLVPLALVAIAGIAIGAIGFKAVQNVKEKRRGAPMEHSNVAQVAVSPAGWYEIPGGSTCLRYWNGLTWTDDFAQRAVAATRINADWYPDPSNAAQVRYWDGTGWTHHIAPAPGAIAVQADWYPDPSDGAQFRYWDGRSWTHHVTRGHGAGVPVHQGHAIPGGAGTALGRPEQRFRMSSAEWNSHVEAWLRAGAIQHELWYRLSNAHIEGADAATLEAQGRMESLTPEEGARRITLMLEAHPVLRQQASFVDLIRRVDIAGGAR